MHWMDGPDERNQEGSRRPGCPRQSVGEKRGKKPTQEKIEQNSTDCVQQDIGEVKSISVIVPKEVIEGKRKVLDRTIVRGIGIEKEIMPKRLQDQQWAFNKWIVVGEIDIIPDQLAGEGWGVNDKGDKRQEAGATPVATEEVSQAAYNRPDFPGLL